MRRGPPAPTPSAMTRERGHVGSVGLGTVFGDGGIGVAAGCLVCGAREAASGENADNFEGWGT